MKNKYLLSLIFSLLLFKVAAQSNYTYVYDASGNRIQRVINGTVPFPVLTASPTSVSTNQQSTLLSNGCGGTYTWSTGHQGINSLVVYPCVTTTYVVSCQIPSCPNVESKSQVTVEQTSPLTNTILTSEKSGNWNDPTVWCCGRIPTLNDLVFIYPRHQVIISDNTAKAKSLKLEIPMSELKYTIGGALKIQGN